MTHITKLTISLELLDESAIEEVLDGLPEYCVSTFKNGEGNYWYGEFQVSCPVAPELAEGDFKDELCTYFPKLLELKTFHSGLFEFHIAVGEPAAESWDMKSHSVALLAALGASINVQTATGSQREY